MGSSSPVSTQLDAHRHLGSLPCPKSPFPLAFGVLPAPSHQARRILGKFSFTPYLGPLFSSPESSSSWDVFCLVLQNLYPVNLSP